TFAPPRQQRALHSAAAREGSMHVHRQRDFIPVTIDPHCDLGPLLRLRRAAAKCTSRWPIDADHRQRQLVRRRTKTRLRPLYLHAEHAVLPIRVTRPQPPAGLHRADACRLVALYRLVVVGPPRRRLLAGCLHRLPPRQLNPLRLILTLLAPSPESIPEDDALL